MPHKKSPADEKLAINYALKFAIAEFGNFSIRKK